MNRFLRLRSVLAAATLGGLLCGCATVRHPVAYREGRPEWTFDITQVAEQDLPPGFVRDQYYLFLGSETVAADTEEAARMGAALNAQEQAKMFLHSHGEMMMTHQIRNDKRAGALGGFDTKHDVMRFQSLLDTRADAQLAHVDAVRWYLEEHRPFWRIIQPFPNDTRASRWRAWCIVAIPRKICDGVIEDAIAAYRQTNTLAAADDRPPARRRRRTANGFPARPTWGSSIFSAPRSKS